MQFDVLTGGKQQCDRMLRYGLRAVCRDVRHRDPPFSCRSKINNVVTRRQNADELQVPCAEQHVPIQFDFVDERNVCSAQALRNHIGMRAVIHRKSTERFQRTPIDVPRIDTISVQNNNLHFHPSVSIVRRVDGKCK